jgi:hypothetical protein
MFEKKSRLFNDPSLAVDGSRLDEDGRGPEAEELTAKIMARLRELPAAQLKEILDSLSGLPAAEDPREMREMRKVRAHVETFSEAAWKAVGSRRGFLEVAREVIRRGGSAKDITG